MAKKILIVDDDPVIRTLLTDYLSSQGFDVRTLAQAGDCLESLRAEAPDLLIIDMIMPDMTGLQVLEELADESQLSELPVIMLSANVEADLQQAGSAQVDRYIQKPFELKVILEAVQNLVYTSKP
jgi:CheY-like chemotaxis protein